MEAKKIGRAIKKKATNMKNTTHTLGVSIMNNPAVAKPLKLAKLLQIVSNYFRFCLH